MTTKTAVKCVAALVVFWSGVFGAVYWASEAHASPESYLSEIGEVLVYPTTSDALLAGMTVCVDMSNGFTRPEIIDIVADSMATVDATLTVEHATRLVDIATENLCPNMLKRRMV